MKERTVGNHVGINRGTVIGVANKGCVVDKDQVGLGKDATEKLAGKIDTSVRKDQLGITQVHIDICYIFRNPRYGEFPFVLHYFTFGENSDVSVLSFYRF